MIVLSGADLVLPDRMVSGGTLIIDGDRIVELLPVSRGPGSDPHLDLRDHYILPGFVDVHIHGLEGHDCLESPDSLAEVAARLPRYGVTAFCPTSIACEPATLARFLGGVRLCRERGAGFGARVLPAHLESNFINPEYAGAQPARCLRLPIAPHQASDEGATSEFTASDILDEVARAAPDVGIVTLAPELPGALDLIRKLRAAGHLVSLGHSAASLEEAQAAINAGARQATHLFNRMPPWHHREPGLAGAVLASDEIAAEIICDGHHVHPAMVRAAVAAKQPSRVMAVTDATSGAGLRAGTRATLGGQPITVRDGAAYLDDGTLAGGVSTMDGAFRMLVGAAGLSPVDAALVCATSPARELGLTGFGVVAPGAVADLVVVDRRFTVQRTFVSGRQIFPRPSSTP